MNYPPRRDADEQGIARCDGRARSGTTCARRERPRPSTPTGDSHTDLLAPLDSCPHAPQMVAMDVLAGLEELGFTEVPDVLASPLSGPSSPDPSEDGRRGSGGGRGSSSSAPEGCSVYVSNLAYAVSRAALARLFGSCGDVRRVSIPLDPVGRCASAPGSS